MTTHYKYDPIKHRRLNFHQKGRALSFASNTDKEWVIKPYDHFTNVDESLDLFQVVELDLTKDEILYRECSRGSDAPIKRLPIDKFKTKDRVFVPLYILDPTTALC